LWQSQDIHTCRSTYYQHLAYIGHNNGIKLELTPHENLSCLAAIKGIAADSQIDLALTQSGLCTDRDVPCIHLSAGQRRRVAIAWLFMTQASIWILDEPLTAIDQDGIDLARSRFSRHLDDGGLIVLTGHQHLQLEDRKIKTLYLST
jgi:heme exporter protein A